MAYNFKNLADVELLSAMPEEANVLVEVNGKTKRAPQVEIPEPIDEIALIVGSETLEEVPEGATVLAEVNGEIKRVPSDGLGGGKVLIIKSSDFDNAMAGVAAAASAAPAVTYTANMTFDEAISAFAACELDSGYIYYVNDIPIPIREIIGGFMYNASYYVSPCLVLSCWEGFYYWTATDGISTTEPNTAQPK